MLALALLVTTRFQVDSSAASRAQAGKAQLDALAAAPEQRECQATAVAQLEAGCRGMGEDLQRRLAVAFTNCHLQQSDLPTYRCEASDTIAECTKPMVDSTSGIAYNSYTHFYTHAESMCFYLQSREFQRDTEAAVDALHSSARNAATQLGDLREQAAEQGRAAAQLLAQQQESAAALLSQGSEAKQQLSSLHDSQAAS
jgi:hypothetical protein